MRVYFPDVAQGFHPDVCRGCLASEALDWGLLVITVAVLLEKDSLSELKHEDGKMMDRRKVGFWDIAGPVVVLALP